VAITRAGEGETPFCAEHIIDVETAFAASTCVSDASNYQCMIRASNAGGTATTSRAGITTEWKGQHSRRREGRLVLAKRRSAELRRGGAEGNASQRDYVGWELDMAELWQGQ